MTTSRFDLEAVIAENKATRRQLLRAIDELAAHLLHERAIGDWSVADLLAHLAGAQAGYAEALECIARGEPPQIANYGPPGPPDGWNDRVVAAAQGSSDERLRINLSAAEERHVFAIRAVPSASYDASETGFPDQFSRALNHAQHYARSATHELQHVQSLVAWSQTNG